MALQPMRKSHKGNLTLEQLQANVAYQETVYKGISALEAKDGETISTHDRKTKVPVNSLILKLNENDDAKGPDGSKPVCKGTAMVEGAQKKVAAFRKGSAAAPAVPPPPPPTG